MLAEEGTGPAWNIKIEEARAGYARLSMQVRADMLNGHGTVHGGMVFALADSAFAYVCNGRNEKAVAAQASIVFLGSANEGKVTLLTAVTKDLVDRVPANVLIGRLAPIIGGKGGGKADLAQAGGKDADKLPLALGQAPSALAEMLGG